MIANITEEDEMVIIMTMTIMMIITGMTMIVLITGIATLNMIKHQERMSGEWIRALHTKFGNIIILNLIGVFIVFFPISL